jgi:hypothetical protein
MPTQRSIGLVLAIALPLLLSVGAAGAQTSIDATRSTDAGAKDEAAALSAQIAHEEAELRTSDCVEACRALASMSRAADRLCALGAGASCDEARARVDAAAQRVRAACPTCTIHATETLAPAPASPVQTESVVTAPRGGCASCTASSAREPGGLALTVAAAFAACGIVRRRRRSSRKV